MTPVTTKVIEKLSAIEGELKRLGRWSTYELSEEQYEDMGAFGVNTMSYEQWLQFILIPTVKDIIESKEEFPDESNTGAYAVRYFDGDPDAFQLISLLCEFDELFN